MSEPVVPVQEPVDNQKEYNFAQLRKQVETERAARIAAEERASQYEKLGQNKPLDDEDDDEPYVDKKRLKKVLSGFEAEMEKKIEVMADRKARSLVEEERTASYLKQNSDFSKIMGSDVVQKFADAYPAMAETILKMPEGFERQKLVYESIKAFGLDKPVPKEMTMQEKVDANRRNPGYQPSSIGGPGFVQQGDFSDTGKKAAYEQMKARITKMRI